MPDKAYHLVNGIYQELSKAEDYVLRCYNMNAYNKISNAMRLVEELADELYPEVTDDESTYM